jgi:DNA-binding beta-propeller fold protein YncE
MDTFNGVLVVTNPWEAAITPDGSGLFVVYSATDDMNACKVIDDDYKEIEGRGGPIQVGKNPRAVRVSPDGKSVWVYAAMDFSVNGFDIQSLRNVARIKTCETLPDERWVHGKYLFG